MKFNDKNRKEALFILISDFQSFPLHKNTFSPHSFTGDHRLVFPSKYQFMSKQNHIHHSLYYKNNIVLCN